MADSSRPDIANMRCRRSRREVIGDGISALTLGAAAPALSVDQAESRFAGSRPAQAPLYPDDSFSRPRVDRLITFRTLDGCGPAGDVRTRVAHFAQFDVRLIEDAGQYSTRWMFTSKDERQAVLSISHTVRRAPTAISFRVRNLGVRPLSLELVLPEVGWASKRESNGLPWSLGAGKEVGPGKEATLQFLFADAIWGGRIDTRGPQYPMGGIMLVATGIDPGARYDLLLDDLTVYYPPAPDLRVAGFKAPRVISAGAQASFELTTEGRVDSRVMDLEVRRGVNVLWRIRLKPQECKSLDNGRCTVVRATPWHLPPGEYTAGLVADGYRVPGREADIQVRNMERPQLPKAERRELNGRPTFFLNGKPFVWEGYASYDYQPGSVAEFGASGTTVFCVPTCAGRHIHHIAAATWIAPDVFNFGELDERVAFSLQANPEGIIFLRVSLTLPAFWTQTHQDDLARIMTDSGPLVWEETGTPATSLASPAWRAGQEHALRALIRHCKAQPWASRLAGFWLTGEVTEEWFAWGCNDGCYADYGTANRERYRAWQDAVRAKRKAPTGGGPAVHALGAASIPAPATRKRPGWDLYPDDAEGKSAADYNEYYSDVTAETIGHFARIVKEETGGHALVGVFYGYVIELAGESRQSTSGHFGLRRIVDDPNIDFLGGVPLLDYRDLANGYNPYCSATESISAAGKLYCNENDLWSWLHPSIWHLLYDSTDPRGGAISMHRRECANDAVHGAMAQKFSLQASWHHDAGLHADFARQTTVYARSQQLDRSPAEEIAFVVDDGVFAWTPPESMLLNAAHKQLLYRLGRTGAPVGVWLLSDLHRLPDRVRLVVVANASAARTQDLLGLEALLCRGGRTVLVVGAPGLVDRDAGRWNRARPAALLGLPIQIGEESGKETVMSDHVGVVTRTWAVRPRAALDGHGTFHYADGKVASAERPLANSGRLIWCGVPPLSTMHLRRWAEEAGVHCYAPPEFFVHAARGVVSITAPVAGAATLQFRQSVSVKDLFDGWSGSGQRIACPFALGQTRLFEVGGKG